LSIFPHNVSHNPPHNVSHNPPRAPRTPLTEFFVGDFDFLKISSVFFRFSPIFFGNVVFAVSSPYFSEPKTLQNTPKIPLVDPSRPINALGCADFSKKRVFWGGKGHDLEQSKEL